MYVYGLRVKDSLEYRYVGITTKSVDSRLSQHINSSFNPKSPKWAVNRWIASHEKGGIVADTLEDLHDETVEYLKESEVLWIWGLRHLGHRLLNLTTGGDLGLAYCGGRNKFRAGENNPNYGKFGDEHPAYNRKLSEATKKRLSNSRKGDKNPNFGKVLSEEQRLLKSLNQKGKSKPSSAKSAHTRWHVNTGVYNTKTCKYCRERDNFGSD